MTCNKLPSVTTANQLPLRRNLWERLATSPGALPGVVIFVSLILDDVIGFWGAIAAAIGISVLAIVFLRPAVRRSRRLRLKGNIARGVLETFVRFTDENNGRTENYGWKEGALLITPTGLAFQQLQGPGGKAVGSATRLGRPKPLGHRPFNAGQAPGLNPDFTAVGLLFDQRELEVVIEPGYLQDSHIRILLTGEPPT